MVMDQTTDPAGRMDLTSVPVGKMNPSPQRLTLSTGVGLPIEVEPFIEVLA